MSLCRPYTIKQTSTRMLFIICLLQFYTLHSDRDMHLGHTDNKYTPGCIQTDLQQSVGYKKTSATRLAYSRILALQRIDYQSTLGIIDKYNIHCGQKGLQAIPILNSSDVAESLISSPQKRKALFIIQELDLKDRTYIVWLVEVFTRVQLLF